MNTKIYISLNAKYLHTHIHAYNIMDTYHENAVIGNHIYNQTWELQRWQCG